MSDQTPAKKTPAKKTPAAQGEIAPVALTDRGVLAKDTAELFRFAEFIAKSALKPRGLQSPSDCFLVMAQGAELGFSPMQSLQSLVVVHGTLYVPGKTASLLIQRHPDCITFRVWVDGEGDAMTGHCLTHRRGRSEPNPDRTFSIEDAKRAGLYDEKWKDRNGEQSNWVRYPKDQLMWKAVGRAQRIDWPDVCQLILAEDADPLIGARNVTPRAADIAREHPTPETSEADGPDPTLALLDAHAPPEFRVERHDRQEPEAEGEAVEGSTGNPEPKETDEAVPGLLLQIDAAIDARAEYEWTYDWEAARSALLEALIEKHGPIPDLGEERLAAVLADVQSVSPKPEHWPARDVGEADGDLDDGEPGQGRLL